MESYIVRIYQRNEKEPGKIVGIVEKVGGEDKKTFASFDELKSILILQEPDSKEKN